jgi:hypothetical protein
VRKKVGIAAAAAVAGMLALSPLAFANDYDRGGNETTSFSFEDDVVQRNQVNLCSSDQDVDVLPSTVVGPILASVSQEQNGNCVDIADGASTSEPTAPPTTTPPPPPLEQQVSPSADYVETSDNVIYGFYWERDLPSDLMNGDVAFAATQACPPGWTLSGGNRTTENPGNQAGLAGEFINNNQGLQWIWTLNTPPAEPSGATFWTVCQRPAAP